MTNGKRHEHPFESPQRRVAERAVVPWRFSIARGALIERALETLARSEGGRTGQTVEDKTAAEAVADILELRKGVTLGGFKIKDLIHEGHRI